MKIETERDLSFPDPDGLGQVGDYAALRGAEGRDVLFRPDRHPRAQLWPVGAAVELTLGGRVHRPDVVDVSQGGVALAWQADLPIEVGAALPELSVSFDGHVGYRGGARISWLRRADGGGAKRSGTHRTIAGVAFSDGTLDLDAVLELRQVREWRGRTGAAELGAASSSWRVAGHERFKALVAELALYLGDCEARLGEMERALPWSVVHGGGDAPARAALIERVRCEVAGDVVAYSAALDAALRAATRAERDALRAFSARHLHDKLMQAPWMHRARAKPLGYPGDFEVMNYVYGNPFSGATLFAKALSLSFLCTPAAEAVRTRKDLVKARLRALVDDRSGGAPVRILSIAAGPAQELVELLQELPRGHRPVELVLYDQDRRALSFAQGRLRGLVRGTGADVRLVCLHDSIKRLLLGADAFSGEGSFDAVYACGLFDYLQTRTAVSLGRSLYGLLAPGGTLYVANMVPANPSRWFMELHLDWYLVYRETAELLDVGRAAAPDARLALLEEATGVNPFISLTRET
jgi:SAM-dependent methyltransferase